MKKALIDTLKETSLPTSIESKILADSINELAVGRNKQKIVNHLKRELSKLALMNKISQDALDLYMRLSKPTVGKYFGYESMTWF